MNIKEIEKIVQIFEGADLHKMEIQSEALSIKLERAPLVVSQPIQPMPVQAPQAVAAEPSEKAEAGHWVNSPLVGTFYSSDVQDGAPLVSLGDRVKKGDLLCIVEAMKMMNEIRSDIDGVITKIAAENGDMVEYGQPLFLVGEDND